MWLLFSPTPLPLLDNWKFCSNTMENKMADSVCAHPCESASVIAPIANRVTLGGSRSLWLRVTPLVDHTHQWCALNLVPCSEPWVQSQEVDPFGVLVQYLLFTWLSWLIKRPRNGPEITNQAIETSELVPGDAFQTQEHSFIFLTF